MPEIGGFDVSLAQGRWKQSFVPKVNSHFKRPIDFEADNLEYELPQNLKFDYSEPGLTLKLWQ